MRVLSLVLLLGVACTGGVGSSPAELAVASTAPEEYAAWRAARAAREAARAKAGRSALAARESARSDGLARQAKVEAAREARVERAEAELAAELERVNAREAAEQQRERVNAEAAMDRAYDRERAEWERLRRTGGNAQFAKYGDIVDFEDHMTFRERKRRWPERTIADWQIGDSPNRWSSTRGLNLSSSGIFLRTHREAWVAFHAAGSRAEADRLAARERAEAEKVAAEAELSARLAEAVAIYDAAGIPAVIALEAAAKSEQAARDRLARVAPEAWAAFVAMLEAER